MGNANRAADGKLCVLYAVPGTVKNDSQLSTLADWRTELFEQRAADAGFRLMDKKWRVAVSGVTSGTPQNEWRGRRDSNSRPLP
jgi:hypothetical protein